MERDRLELIVEVVAEALGVDTGELMESRFRNAVDAVENAVNAEVEVVQQKRAGIRAFHAARFEAAGRDVCGWCGDENWRCQNPECGIVTCNPNACPRCKKEKPNATV